jgi:hypothetical protein
MYMDEIEQYHSMTYAEREALKSFAQRGECLSEVIVAIAHWMREAQDVTLTGYISNWAEANQSQKTAPMRKQWPLSGPRMIADGSSEWGSAVS